MSFLFKALVSLLLIVAPVFAGPHKNHDSQLAVSVATVTKSLKISKISDDRNFQFLMKKFDALEKVEEAWNKKQTQKALAAATKNVKSLALNRR